MGKLEIFKEEDRLTAAAILVKNGYRVRQTRERVEGKRSYLYFLEYDKPRKSTGEEERE